MEKSFVLPIDKSLCVSGIDFNQADYTTHATKLFFYVSFAHNTKHYTHPRLDFDLAKAVSIAF